MGANFTNFKGQGFGAVNIFAESILNGTDVIDPISLADGAGETVTITVTGAAIGDYATVAPGVDVLGVVLSSTVTSANTVSCRLQNETGGVVDLASSTWKAKVIQDGL